MTARKRNLGIELLRTISMLCVVIQHIIGHGWVIQTLHPGTWKYELVVALRSFALCGICCFALISGYVGVRSRYRYSSLVLQWTKVWIYSLFFALLFSVLVPGSVDAKEWKTALNPLLPLLHRRYWYFTAYFGCAMIAPVILKAVRQMTFKQGTACAATLVFTFAILANAARDDIFHINAGSSVLWLVVLYIIGAYFGQFRPHERIPMSLLWAGTVCLILLMTGLQPVAQRFGIKSLSAGPNNDSIQTLLMAVFMLMLFSRLEIRRGQRWITWLGGASFGVYVIHEHPLVRYYTISKYSYLLTSLSNVGILAGIVAAAAAVYLCCALVDGLRENLYKKLKIRQRLDALERRLIGDLWAN